MAWERVRRRARRTYTNARICGSIEHKNHLEQNHVVKMRRTKDESSIFVSLIGQEVESA
ncbi:unnamed protein product [Clavelina lepadiformis]|uniref:Uncharacterized protein n=1 Tax=Clavelina lepadiformis TaxID=159417 RepID=A0ABP0GAD9_CLALP